MGFPKHYTFSLEKPLNTNVPYHALKPRIRQVRKVTDWQPRCYPLVTVLISSHAMNGALGTKGGLLSVILVKSEGLHRKRKNAIYLHESS